jgi:hypothetical protein
MLLEAHDNQYIYDRLFALFLYHTTENRNQHLLSRFVSSSPPTTLVCQSAK